MWATFDLKTLAGRSMRQSPHRVAVIRTKINQTEAVCTAGAVKIASSMRYRLFTSVAVSRESYDVRHVMGRGVALKKTWGTVDWFCSRRLSNAMSVIGGKGGWIQRLISPTGQPWPSWWILSTQTNIVSLRTYRHHELIHTITNSRPTVHENITIPYLAIKWRSTCMWWGGGYENVLP